MTYTREDITAISTSMLDKLIDDCANKSNKSFQEYDYGYWDGVKEFKNTLERVLSNMEEDEYAL